jgi:hypothetical protein
LLTCINPEMKKAIRKDRLKNCPGQDLNEQGHRKLCISNEL